MEESRFSKEQIIGALREHEAGAKSEEVCQRHRISRATLYKWKSKYGGLEVSKRIRQPNAQLLAPAIAATCR